ncbi:Dihydroorotate dehydrogenase-like protein 1 [Elsinoe fawcettii]|nr:Dihydroorotate dehydrogenase-like protein 1 [Elsinoe fawcettii]
MGLPQIDPPLLNSANPWCTTLEDLQGLYDCPETGAITTRTSLIDGFPHDPAIHQHTFFDPQSHTTIPKGTPDYDVSQATNSSLNTLGYSPIPLSEYLSFISSIRSISSPKPTILSVTGDPAQILTAYTRINEHLSTLPPTKPLLMEINLSCPNIPSAPPPAYSGSSLLKYLTSLQSHPDFVSADRKVRVGIKTPPYTYHDQFATLISALKQAADDLPEDVTPIDFITATNTLGSCLLLDDAGSPILNSASGAGVGGMAGAALHPLALGNVRTIRTLLDAEPRLKSIDIIGVGGVEDAAGAKRMRAAGAKVVGVGTALGREGVGVFTKINGQQSSR